MKIINNLIFGVLPPELLLSVIKEFEAEFKLSGCLILATNRNFCKLLDFFPEEQLLKVDTLFIDRKNISTVFNDLQKIKNVFIPCRDINDTKNFKNILNALLLKKIDNIYLIDIKKKQKKINNLFIIFIFFINFADAFIYQTFIIILSLFLLFITIFLSIPIRFSDYLRISKNKKFKVFFGTRIHSNQGKFLSDIFKKNGYYSLCVNKAAHTFLYENSSDQIYNVQNAGKYKRLLILSDLFLNNFYKFDIFHFINNGETILSTIVFSNWDLPEWFENYDVKLLKILGKKIVFTYRDCSIRNPKVLKNKDELCVCNYCNDSIMNALCQNPYIKIQNSNAVKYGNKIFVSTPDLLEFLPDDTIWLPNIAATQNSNFYYSDKIRITHISGSPVHKGTSEVEIVFNELKKNYSQCEISSYTGLQQKDYWEKLINTDIFVDQFRCGAYGQSAIEAMALKCVVVSYIRNDVKKRYPNDLPIIITDINDLKNALIEIIENPEKISRLKLKNYEYFIKYHSSENVYKLLKKEYDKLYF